MARWQTIGKRRRFRRIPARAADLHADHGPAQGHEFSTKIKEDTKKKYILIIFSIIINFFKVLIQQKKMGEIATANEMVPPNEMLPPKEAVAHR